MKVHVPWYACAALDFVERHTPHKTLSHMTNRLITSSTGKQHTAHCVWVALLHCCQFFFCFCFIFVFVHFIFQIWIVNRRMVAANDWCYNRLWLCHSIFRFQFFFLYFSNSRSQSELAEMNRQNWKMISWTKRLNTACLRVCVCDAYFRLKMKRSFVLIEDVLFVKIVYL